MLFSTMTLAKVVKLEEQLLDFEIYDITLDDKILLFESSDIYFFNKIEDDPIALLPFNAVTSALEINVSYLPSSQQFKGELNNNKVLLSLESPPSNFNWDIFIAIIDDEIFIDTKTLAILIDANIDIFNTKLTLLLTPNSEAFPIQKRIERSKRKVKTQKLSDNRRFDFIVNDQYRLFTPPSGHISAAFNSNNNTDSEVQNKYSLNINTRNDLLYHSANLSLSQKDDKLNSRLTFNRNKSNPTDNIIANITRYSFGDVSTQNNRANQSSSGLGVTVSSNENLYTSYFGEITIDEFASANWQAELYRNGYLIETDTVTSEGRIIFEGIKTQYGTNRFEIKLYGPYGEEEVITRNVLVGNTQLKVDQLKYSAGLLDTNRSMLNDNHIFNSDIDFSPSAFVQTEYGLTTETSLGLGLFLQENLEADTSTQEIILSLTQQLPNALLETSLKADNDENYQFLSNIIGKFYTNSHYSFNFNYLTNNSETGNDTERFDWNGNFSSNFKGLSYNFNAASQIVRNVSNDISNKSTTNSLSNRIGWRYKRFNLSNTISYTDTNQNSNKFITDRLTVSTPLSDDLYLRASANFNLSSNINEETNRLTSIDSSLNWRVSNQLKINSGISHDSNSDTTRFNTALSWRNDNYNVNFNSSYDSDERWLLSLGISFGLDYDYHTKTLNVTNTYSPSTGTLDLFSYIDNNQNAIYDEYDEVLEGVMFGSNPYWENLASQKNGTAYLPGVSTNSAVKIAFDTNNTRSSMLEPVQDNFRFFTHPGGVVSLDIPFNYTTEVEGAIDVSSEVSAKFIPLELLNEEGTIIDSITADSSGYYLVNKIWPGNYKLRVEPEYLKSKSLKSTPEVLQFSFTGADEFITLTDFTIDFDNDKNLETEKNNISIINSSDNTEPNQLSIKPVENVIANKNSTAPHPKEVSQIRLLLPQTAIKMPVEKATTYKHLPLAQTVIKIPVEKAITHKRLTFAQTAISIPVEKSPTTQSKKKELITPAVAIATPYIDNNSIFFSIQLGAYKSENACSDKVILLNEVSSIIIFQRQVSNMCKIYTGKFTNKRAAINSLNELPASIKNKGAFIVKI